MRIRLEELREDTELDQKTLDIIQNRYAGFTIYVSKNDSKKMLIKRIWLEQSRMNVPKAKIVKVLVQNYNINRYTAYRTIKRFENEDRRDRGRNLQ